VQDGATLKAITKIIHCACGVFGGLNEKGFVGQMISSGINGAAIIQELRSGVILTLQETPLFSNDQDEVD
jgi:hypothetical protein